jgi:hypothetical protein
MQKLSLCLISLMTLLLSMKWMHVCAEERHSFPLIVASGGYLDTRGYSGGVLRLEYKYQKSYWRNLRPQATLLLSQFLSGYIGWGLGWEFYFTRQIVITPSFSSGIYWKGRGRELGYPLEFLSSLDISYETESQLRLGIQIFHVSNAHLSPQNPGFNALTFGIAFPLRK